MSLMKYMGITTLNCMEILLDGFSIASKSSTDLNKENLK